MYCLRKKKLLCPQKHKKNVIIFSFIQKETIRIIFKFYIIHRGWNTIIHILHMSFHERFLLKRRIRLYIMCVCVCICIHKYLCTWVCIGVWDGCELWAGKYGRQVNFTLLITTCKTDQSKSGQMFRTDPTS